MKKDIFNVKQEVLFVSLASHAKWILDHHTVYDQHIVDLSTNLLKHFTKKIKRYTTKQSDKLKDEIVNNYDVVLKNNDVQLDVLLLCSLDYLYSVKHYETTRYFAHKRFAVVVDVGYLQTLPETKGYVAEVNRFISLVLGIPVKEGFISKTKERIMSLDKSMFDTTTYLHKKLTLNLIAEDGDISIYNNFKDTYSDEVIYNALLTINMSMKNFNVVKLNGLPDMEIRNLLLDIKNLLDVN